jgi:hypothetical protein
MEASGGNLVLRGVGAPNGTCWLLASTNVTLPVETWLPISSNQFDSIGNCSIVVPLDSQQPVRFYRLVVP